MKITTDRLTPGMKLKEDIIYNNSLLLPKNVELTARLIQLVKSWEIRYIYIEDDSKQQIKNREKKQTIFQHNYQDKTKQIMNVMDGIRGSQNIDEKEITELADNLIEFSKDIDYIRLISELKTKDDYTYQHCINVGLYSALIANWLNFEDYWQRNLCISAILHDIGKIKIPSSILNKPGPLTKKEFQEVKQHPKYGYEVIAVSQKFDKEVKLGILQHHERNNGNGYPLGLTENNISLYAKIIAVADTFDAITSNRCYDQRKAPFEAVKIIRDEAFTNLDPQISILFFNRILDFFKGSQVILNTGQLGEIKFFHKDNFFDPVVQIGESVIDLSQDYEKEIVDVLIF